MKECFFRLTRAYFVICRIKVIVNLLYGYVMLGSNLAPAKMILFTKNWALENYNQGSFTASVRNRQFIFTVCCWISFCVDQKRQKVVIFPWINLKIECKYVWKIWKWKNLFSLILLVYQTKWRCRFTLWHFSYNEHKREKKKHKNK